MVRACAGQVELWSFSSTLVASDSIGHCWVCQALITVFSIFCADRHRGIGPLWGWVASDSSAPPRACVPILLYFSDGNQLRRPVLFLLQFYYAGGILIRLSRGPGIRRMFLARAVRGPCVLRCAAPILQFYVRPTEFSSLFHTPIQINCCGLRYSKP